MYTLSNKFYCGVPEELWDNLISEAEDLFTEKEIGSHIVGIYPAGPRIYGIESSSQGILCLYIDSVESALNPFLRTKSKPRIYNIGLQLSPVYFLDLYYYIDSIITDNLSFNSLRLKLFDIVPAYSDIFHQDQSIDSLINILHEYISEKNYKVILSLDKEAERQHEYALYLRTLYILNKKNVFAPNINPAYGKVESIDISLIEKIDKLLLEDPLKITRSNYDDYYRTLYNKIITSSDKDLIDKLKNKLGEELHKIYRYLL